MFQFAKINIFSLLNAFPKDFKRIAYFCISIQLTTEQLQTDN
jgi:hypothetical protein